MTQPTAVLELLQAAITHLAAGRNNSAAVVHGTDAYVWGDGLCGKLGLGSGVHASAPSRVEAFVGRCAIQDVSLGHHHSLFLDTGVLIVATACVETGRGSKCKQRPELCASSERCEL